MEIPSSSNKKSRWKRIGVRALLAVVIVSLIGSAWVAWSIREERQRVAAIASIKARGGNYFEGGHKRQSLPRGLLREFLRYRSIEAIRIPDDLTDEELRGIERSFPEAEIWVRLSAKDEDPIRMKAIRTFK